MSSTERAIAVIDLGDFSDRRVRDRTSQFAQRKLGGQTLLMRMARRISECELISNVVIVGSKIPAALLRGGHAGVRILNLPSMHVCERLGTAAETTDAQWIVCLPANRPFVDAVLIDQLVAKAFQSRDVDYVGYGTSREDSGRIDRIGLTGEACHADTLRRLRGNAEQLPTDHQDRSIANWIGLARGEYECKFIPLPDALDRDDLRFTVEDESDWDDVQLLCETVPAEDSQWQQLTQVISAHSGLRESMATRNS